MIRLMGFWNFGFSICMGKLHRMYNFFFFFVKFKNEILQVAFVSFRLSFNGFSSSVTKEIRLYVHNYICGYIYTKMYHSLFRITFNFLQPLLLLLQEKVQHFFAFFFYHVRLYIRVCVCVRFKRWLRHFIFFKKAF